MTAANSVQNKTRITRASPEHPCQFKDTNIIRIQLSFLSAQEMLSKATVSKSFNAAVSKAFPQAAAGKLIPEAESDLDESTNYRLSVPPPGMSLGDMSRWSLFDHHRPLKIVISYLGDRPSQIYQMAARRVNQYFGKDLIDCLGGMRHYACVPQITFSNENTRAYLDMVEFDAMKKPNGTLAPVKKTRDAFGRLGLAIIFRDGSNRAVKVLHKRHKEVDNEYMMCFPGDSRDVRMSNCTTGYLKPLTQKIKEAATGTNLTTTIDIPRLLQPHQENLTRRIIQDLATFLQFTKLPLFHEEVPRRLVAGYLYHHEEDAILELRPPIFRNPVRSTPQEALIFKTEMEKRNQEYQALVATWTREFPLELISSLGGVYSINLFRSDMDVKMGHPYFSDRREFINHAPTLELLKQAMKNRSILVIETKHDYSGFDLIMIKFQDKHTKNECIYFLFQEKNWGKVTLFFTPWPDSPHSMDAVNQLAGPPSPDKYTCLKQMILGVHPTVCVAPEKQSPVLNVEPPPMPAAPAPKNQTSLLQKVLFVFLAVAALWLILRQLVYKRTQPNLSP